MALKQLMIKKKIEAKRSQLDGLGERVTESEKRSDELEKSLEEVESEEELAIVSEEVEELEKEKENLEEERTNLEKEIKKLEGELEQLNSKVKTTEVREVKNEDREISAALNNFIRSKGQERAGVKIVDAEAVIPESISYNPKKEVETIDDLSKFVTQTPVTTGSGKYPMIKRATAKMNSVAELEKNPELAKPEFTEVSWAVETYRAAIPISQEAIDDSAVDLVKIISANAMEQKVNTTNHSIAEVLKTFTAKTATSLDDIKKILNVDLDIAYAKDIVVTKSFYQIVDTMKDAMERYIMHQDITSETGKTLLGCTLHIVNDTALGVPGDAKIWIGDLERAVLYANRKEITARWVDNEIYGQYLQVGTRFDVVKADAKAGFFVTYTATTI